MRRAAAPAVLLLLALARPAPSSASPLEIFGFGGRSPALAATGVASADDFECLYLNPAGLADVTRKRVSIGTLLGDFSLEGVDRAVDRAVGVEVGVAFRLPLGGALRDRVGLGVGIYVPTRVLNRARAPRPGDPFFALLENRSEVVGIQVALGARLGERWSVGAGFIALGGLIGAIDVAPDNAGRFATTSEQQLIASFAPVLGVRFRAGPRWSAGATLHFTSRSSYDILITADLGESLPVSIPPLRVAGVAQYDPTALALEIAFRPTARALLALQLAGERWSQFPAPTRNPVEGMPAQEPPGFHDTATPRLAAEWHVADRPGSTGVDVALRGGYAFVPSPAPEMTGRQALLDNHRNVLSAGIGIVKAPFHVDLWSQLHLLVDRHHDRPDDVPDIDTGGSILSGGLVLGVDL